MQRYTAAVASVRRHHQCLPCQHPILRAGGKEVVTEAGVTDFLACLSG